MDEDDKERPLGVLAASLWCVAATMATMLLAAIFEATRPGATHDVILLTVSRLCAVSAVLFGIARVHGPDEKLTNLVSAKSPRPVFFLLAVVLGLSLCVSLEWIDELLAARFPSQDEGETLKALLEQPVSKRLAFALALGLVKPICDEVLFRGAIFNGMSKVRPIVDTAVTTVLLELLLGDSFIITDPRSFVLAVGFAASATYLRALSGSMLVTLVAHVVFSVDVFLVMLRPDWVSFKVAPVVGVGSLVVVALTLLVARAVARHPPKPVAET